MSTGDHKAAHIDGAAISVIGSGDRSDLARQLCDAVSAAVDATTVILVEADSTGVRELERSERNSEVGHARTPRVEVHELLRPGQPDIEVTDVTILDVTSTGVHTVLVIDKALDREELESARFLVQLAMATADRLDSEERVRDQNARILLLGENIRDLEASIPTAHNARDTSASEFASSAALLTERERDILEHILEGAPNATIATTFTLSVETVKTHVKHILRKMGAANRAELIARSG